MGFIFDSESSIGLENWYRSEAGKEIARLQTDLALRLIRPRIGERLVDVGCGSGVHLQLFKNRGLDVTGVEPSVSMLDLARERLGTKAGLFPGRAEELPFEDNEYDIVSFFTSLEFVDNIDLALAEAVRVARSRIFIGALNSLSLTALGRRAKGIFWDSIYNRANFFTVWGLAGRIERLVGPTRIHWATVGILPPVLVRYTSGFEARPLVQKAPFGAYLGLVAHVAYRYRTDNLVVDSGYKVPKRATSPTPSMHGLVDRKSPPDWDMTPKKAR